MAYKNLPFLAARRHIENLHKKPAVDGDLHNKEMRSQKTIMYKKAIPQ